MIIEQQQRPWTARMVHLQDILAPVDVFRKVLRMDLQELYNSMLRRGWTLGSGYSLRVMQQMIRMWHPTEVRLLKGWFSREAPDLLVSVVPNFNRAIFEAWSTTAPGRPYVTILTDLADYPPRFWMERQPQYFICGSDKAVEQARAIGHPAERVYRASGMVLHPRFYETVVKDLRTERLKLGLDPDLPTALVLFGGFGSMAMAGILEQLDRLTLPMQAIFICGRNERLKQVLDSHPSKFARHTVGFTREVPYYMGLSDFFIGKPGPGSISEAVHLGLPVLTVSNSLTLPQERYNGVWLEEYKLGILLKSYSQVAGGVQRLLDGRLEEYRQNCLRMNNRAVFEIPEILDEIATRHGI